MITLKPNYEILIGNSLPCAAVNNSGKIEWVNQRFLELFDYQQPNDVLGKPFKEIGFPTQEKLHFNTGLKEGQQITVGQGGKPVYVSLQQLQGLLYRKVVAIFQQAQSIPLDGHTKRIRVST